MTVGALLDLLTPLDPHATVVIEDAFTNWHTSVLDVAAREAYEGTVALIRIGLLPVPPDPA